MRFPEDFQGDVVVLSGDVPLLDVQSIQQLLEIHRESGNAGTLISTVLDNANGYGRILRSNGNFLGIVEQKDASPEQLLINEVNAGVYIFNGPGLFAALEKVTTANAQGEKYLTDVAALMLANGDKVSAHSISDHWLVAGINDRHQLSQVALELNQRILKAWQLAGVSIQEPAINLDRCHRFARYRCDLVAIDQTPRLYFHWLRLRDWSGYNIDGC